ncbi:MAG: DUF808 domain-containing protein [Saccharospirillaceae bacterium]|nr:DUF808 domain-containing protein [Saccharospirillaceae bacterium]
MAGGQFFALLDDITLLLDDVALMSKVATKKTAALLGDDLALNAQQVSVVKADRELPVVYEVAKGAILNKLILIPIALFISVFLPWLLTPLLMVGGAYLCFEGAEKVLHFLFHRHELHESKEKLITAISDPSVDLMEYEKTKIKGAIRTDFILSAEIIVIALTTVAHASLLQQFLVLCIVGIGLTFVVYGLVALLVRLDDIGLWLNNKSNKLSKIMGQFLLNLAPLIMRGMTILGTLAMFLVGGGIYVHGLAVLHHAQQWLHESIHFYGSVTILDLLFTFSLGFAIGLIVLAFINSGHLVISKVKAR